MIYEANCQGTCYSLYIEDDKAYIHYPTGAGSNIVNYNC